MPTPSLAPTESALRLHELAERWRGTALGERQAFQSWFLEFCDALGVERPAPDGGGSYCFEQPVKVIRLDGTGETTNFIDCWKAGHVAIEAKATGVAGSNEIQLRRAYRQLTQYVSAEPGTVPPYLMVVDVPREIIVWEGWGKPFGGFAAGRRMALDSLADRPGDVALLQDILSRPDVRDPRGKAQQVTREIATRLAELAATYENRGFESERVARFLMRCVFCLFAEDVGLLPKTLFERTLSTAQAQGSGDDVAAVLLTLWRTMDTGGMFGADRIQQFNGHFFRTVEALPLEPADIRLLIEAARFDWSQVEPSIFGTLLVRALEPEERHRLGAEYTPREYIERLVEPTVLEPIRERWTAVQARVSQLEEEGSKKDLAEAEQEVLAFHRWMRGLRFLDPACGSGNFLYVTLAAVKRIELEALTELRRLHSGQEAMILEEVHPRQFHGIEVNWWAREIAELTLWIGYHQFWREAHGGRTPPSPILEDTGTIECRDAILAWDEIVHRLEKDRPDPTPRIAHPVTGELVPDPEAKLPYLEYVNARMADWPEADFILGNPPYIGSKRMRDALGDGYVDALRSSYPDVPESADLVIYWLRRAGARVGSGEVLRAGLITTNSLVQSHAQPVIRLLREMGAHIVWAIRDHPWTDDVLGAAIRVAMVTFARRASLATLVTVDAAGDVVRSEHAVRLNDDLTATIDIATASSVALASNRGIASMGFALHGAGFLIEQPEAERLLGAGVPLSRLKPLLAGRDLTQRPRRRWVIDFGYAEESEARLDALLFGIVRDRVKPERDANAREVLRKYWWRFGWPRRELRAALEGLGRYIATTETSKHRTFQFLEARIAPDHSIVAIATEDPVWLGCLSSVHHRVWAIAAGARLGVGNDPRYTKTRCFDSYPFPDPPVALRARIGAVAEQLDQHRKEAITRDEAVTITRMYNVVEKLGSGDMLTPKERRVHEVASCGILKDLHSELDALVAEAYGWSWPMGRDEILEQLIALHDKRVAEEQRGHIRWLRPDYQLSRFIPSPPVVELEVPDAVRAPEQNQAAGPSSAPWPETAVEQLAALQGLLARRSVSLAEAAGAFEGAESGIVRRHLETLVILGELTVEAGRFRKTGAVM